MFLILRLHTQITRMSDLAWHGPQLNLTKLEDKRPIGRFLLALAEGRLVKNLTDERGGSDALIVRWKLLQNICSYKKSGNQHSKHE